MDRMNAAHALREDTNTHYNCTQAVLIPFCDLCGIDQKTAFLLGKNFGSGMYHGGTCGALTGALMVVGMTGHGREMSTELTRRFREKNQALDCASLLRLAHERGEVRKSHCDRMVFDAVEILCDLLEDA